jgi:hypothetical protein
MREPQAISDLKEGEVEKAGLTDSDIFAKEDNDRIIRNWNF